MGKRFMPRFFSSDREGEEIVTVKRIDVSHLEKISLLTEAVDVIIQTHEEDAIDLVFTTFEEGPEMEVEQTDNGLHVEIVHPHRVHIQIGFLSSYYPKASLVLKVPPKIADIWEVLASSRRVIVGPIEPKVFYAKVGSGTLECPSLQAEQIDLKVTSGRMKCGLLEADEIFLNVTSGKGTIDHLHSKKMAVEFTSGDMHIENISGNMFKGKGSSGKITFRNVSVDYFEQKCSSGSVKIDRMNTVSMEGSVTSGKMQIYEITSNAIDVRTTSGKIDLTLGEEQKDWHLQMEVSSGRIDAPSHMHEIVKSAKRVEGTIGEGKNKLYAKASSGSIIIR